MGWLELDGRRVDLETGDFEGPEGRGRLSGRERALLAELARASGRTLTRETLQ